MLKMENKTSKAVLFFVFFLLLIVSCSKQETIKPNKTEQNLSSQLVLVPVPSDIPVYPGAEQISNEKGENFMRVVFSVSASVKEIKTFYSEEMPGKWAVPKEWFKLGNTEQRYHTTEDYDENKKTGRSVIIIVAPDNKDSAKSVVSLVITDFNK